MKTGTPFMIRLTNEEREALSRLAERNFRSATAQLRAILREAVQKAGVWSEESEKLGVDTKTVRVYTSDTSEQLTIARSSPSDLGKIPA